MKNPAIYLLFLISLSIGIIGFFNRTPDQPITKGSTARDSAMLYNMHIENHMDSAIRNYNLSKMYAAGHDLKSSDRHLAAGDHHAAIADSFRTLNKNLKVVQ